MMIKIWLKKMHQKKKKCKHFPYSSVAGPDPGSGAFLTPRSGIRNRFFPDSGSQTHMFESFLLSKNKKLYNSLKIVPNFFYSISKLK